MNQPKTSRWRRGCMLAGAFLVLVAVLVYGRVFAAWQARWAADRQLRIGAIHESLEWLVWANWLDPGDYRADLMRAACFRQLVQQNEWRAALEAARQKGAPSYALETEATLGELRRGQVEQVPDGIVEALLEAGVSRQEATTAVVYGLLAKEEPTRALALVETWRPDPKDQAQAAFLRGVVRRSLGDPSQAKAEFEKALDQQPRHEPAGAALAQLLEEQNRLDQALVYYASVATAAPEWEAMKLGTARVLRKLGRVDDARSILGPPSSPPDASMAVAAELGQIEFEAGNYAAAKRWLEQVDSTRTDMGDAVRAAIGTLAMTGDAAKGQRLVAEIIESQSRSRQVNELQRRLALDPTDAAAAAELRSALAPAAAPPKTTTDGAAAALVSPLYAEHCAACHGANGDGRGHAARHLFPRPRDLRRDHFRLVSTLNAAPTHEDIERVIERGIPGTAMPSFARLPEDQRRSLAEQVQQFRREGIRERLIEQSEDEGRATVEDEIQRAVAVLTTSGEVLPVPEIGPPDAAAISRGKDLYLQVGCPACHGADGTGAPDTLLWDDRDQPTAPRDLVRDPMKGGPEPESLYRRIRLGMPGTPHPACPSLEETELIELVQFCRSLAQKPTRALTNYQRSVRAARPYSTAAVAPTSTSE